MTEKISKSPITIVMAASQMSITDKQSELIDRFLEWGEGTGRFMYETFQYIVKAKLR